MSKFWRMRNGHLIALSDMEDSHLINTLAMVRRNKVIAEKQEVAFPKHWQKLGEKVDRCERWIRIFEEEVNRRGPKVPS